MLKKILKNETLGFWVTVIGFPLLLLIVLVILLHVSPYAYGPIGFILLVSLFSVVWAAIRIIRNKDKYLKKS
jgi:hypothetical protein